MLILSHNRLNSGENVKRSLKDLDASELEVFHTKRNKKSICLLDIGFDALSYTLDFVEEKTDLRLVCKLFKDCIDHQIKKLSLKHFPIKAGSFLRSLKKLEVLSLPKVDPLHYYMPEITVLTSLKHLDLTKNFLTTLSLELMSGFNNLSKLCLIECELQETDISNLKLLTKLEDIDFFRAKNITDSSLETLGTMTHLKKLGLSRTKITNYGLSHLSSLTGCIQLDISECSRINSEGLTKLCTLTNLNTLDLSELIHLNNRFLKQLSSLENLNVLFLSRCGGIGNNGIKYVGANFKHLEMLFLDDIPISDIGVSYLSVLTSLNTLSLNNCDIVTDTGLYHLRSLTQMQYLNLSCLHAINDSGIKRLKKLTHLQKLDVSFCNRITEASLNIFSKFSLLKSLNLYGCELISIRSIYEFTNIKKDLHLLHDLIG
jgi:F-box/leucine-rich repeat protein 14